MKVGDYIALDGRSLGLPTNKFRITQVRPYRVYAIDDDGRYTHMVRSFASMYYVVPPNEWPASRGTTAAQLTAMHLEAECPSQKTS